MIALDYRDPRPIYEQVVQKLADLILAGVLQENEQLPSVRGLASELSINPNTIQRAYAELDRQGYTYTVKGKGSFVAGSEPLREKRRNELLKEFRLLAAGALQAEISMERLIGELESVRQEMSGTDKNRESWGDPTGKGENHHD
ncbi:MAG: GntR family transcriptional regulator [Lachnospiraceae bacterium]|nr:GntR family transcriptional regulator [Lachnospiraceae bacterium]